MAPAADISINEIVNGFLRAWAAALAAADFKGVADLFDESAVFVAMAPAPLRGRRQIQTYFEQAPTGLRVKATLVCTTQPLADLVHAIAEVAFEAPGIPALQGRLGLSLIRTAQGWRASAYQLTVNRPASNLTSRLHRSKYGGGVSRNGIVLFRLQSQTEP